MNGNLMYEMTRQRLAEQERTARRAGEARGWRAIARGRHARAAEAQAPVLPAIPDFAHELLSHKGRETVPAPRPEAGRGRHSRTSR
jgi:hypothetical protein